MGGNQQQLQKEFDLEFGDTNAQQQFLDQDFNLNQNCIGFNGTATYNEERIDYRYLLGKDSDSSKDYNNLTNLKLNKDDGLDKLNQFLNMSMT